MEEFKIKYQNAYEQIRPRADYLEKLYAGYEKGQRNRREMFWKIMRPAAAVCVCIPVLLMTLLSVAAKSVPAVYDIVARYAPALADFVLPVSVSDTSRGITMQVEAVNVEDKTTELSAELIVSFSDAEGSDTDRIKGKADLYESYHLESYGASYSVGGCRFLAYDEMEDKAFFKIDLTTDGRYENGRIKLCVSSLLTDVRKEQQDIPLDDILEDPRTKPVSLNGFGGREDREAVAQYIGSFDEDSPLPDGLVMDIVKPDESMLETLTVTGVGYSDGLLRIQSCRGTFRDVDRHIRPYLVDESGEERHEDYSLMWHEEVNGETICFDEHWFLLEESELEKVRVYGIFYVTAGNVDGNWEVVCEIP